MANEAAWDQGWALGSGRRQEQRAHKQALSDEQFQEKHNEIQGMIENLQTKLANISDKNSVDYLQTKDQLAQALQSRDAHWGEQNHPSALVKFGRMIGKDLRFPKKDAPPVVAPPVYNRPTMDVDGEQKPIGPAYKIQGPQTPAQIKAAAEATQLASAAPITPEQQAANTETARINAQLDAIQKSPLSEENKQKAIEAVFKIFKSAGNKVYKAPDGTIYAADINDPDSFIPGSVPYSNPTVGSIEIEQYRQAQAEGYTGTIYQFKADSTKSKAVESQWIRAHYGGRDLDQLSPEEADEAVAKYREENTPTTTSTGQSLVYDQNNQPHIFTHTATSSKNFPGAKGAPSAPPTTPSVASPNGATTTKKTPADVKKEADKVRPKSTASPIGPALDFTKMSPEVAAAKKDVDAATALVDIADRAEKAPDDVKAGLQRQVAASIQNTLEKRFNQQAFDNLIHNYGIANNFQAWLEKQETGALPDSIFKQLVAIAHSNLEGKKAALASAMRTPDSGQGNQDGNKSLADRLHEAYGAKEPQ
jgi:hypothetical protein